MHFWGSERSQISKFPGGACPWTPPDGSRLRRSLALPIKKYLRGPCELKALSQYGIDSYHIKVAKTRPGVKGQSHVTDIKHVRLIDIQVN